MVILPNIRRKYMVDRRPTGAPVDMAECVVTLAADRMAYTGSARTVGVTVTWQGAALAVNTDYTLVYANNVNLGPATVTVTGAGQFTGSVTKTFYIVENATEWSFDISQTADSPLHVDNGSVALGESGTKISLTGSGLVYLPGSNAKIANLAFANGTDIGNGFTANGVSDALTGMTGGGISMDGRKFFYLNDSMLRQAAVTTPWSVTGLSFEDAVQLSDTHGCRKLVLSGDGMSLFLVGRYDNGLQGMIYRHALSVPNDLSTVSAEATATIDLSQYARSGKYQDFCFSPAGGQMLWADGGVVYQFQLASAWDPSTATLMGSKTFSAHTTASVAVTVNAAGTRLLLGGGAYLREWELA